MFTINRPTGFQMTFDNDWTVSVQFGGGTYSDHRDAPLVPSDDMVHNCASQTAEVAAYDARGDWYIFDEPHNTKGQGGEYIRGWQTTDNVAAFIQTIQALPKGGEWLSLKSR